MDASLFLFDPTRAHEWTPSLGTAREAPFAPWAHHASALLRSQPAWTERFGGVFADWPPASAGSDTTAGY